MMNGPAGLDRLFLGLRFYLGFAPGFSRIGFRRRGLAERPVEADFSGQTWLVTGASGGIGRAVVLEAARRGARVIAVARSRARLDELAAALPDGGVVETLAADLSLLAEARALVRVLVAAERTIQVLVHNVGVLCREHGLTTEGFETAFATNLLVPYALTEQLVAEDVLADGAQVITVSSGGMYATPLLPDRLDAPEAAGYDGVLAYARHKRAQVSLTRHWNRRHGPGRSFHVMHPGWVDTAGVRTSLPAFRRLFRPVLRTPEQGADTILWLAAERPAPPAEGIWLDRSLRPEHASRATRAGDRALPALVDRLERARDRIDP